MFVWRYLDASGAELGSSEAFDDREGAEAWMGEEWATLLERGIEQVALTDGERTLYRMGLREA
jgi:hypothetical protein